jgi:adenylate cyclase
MADEGFKRKLTAILSADVAGYSRLMGDDEEATVRILTTYREVLTSLIQQHNGKVLDSTGDNLLAEFVSVVDAVQCAVSVQKEIQSRNAALSENRRMQFRIGINLGDVIEEEDRIYGDGVNIAARLEGLAEPGGICISKTAFDHIESKLPYGYEYIGDQTVKNIPKPVGAYRVQMEPRVTVPEPDEAKPARPERRRTYFIGAAALAVIVILAGVWYFNSRPSFEPASMEKMAFPLPDKPSIAVLPFENLSDDSAKDMIVDGITTNIITLLSKVPTLFVISSRSTFAYKGKPVKVQQVAEALGVQYVLEGSVQKSGDQLRMTAQLVDALEGHHLWTERYDREFKDVFAIQDEIALSVVSALQLLLSEGEKVRVVRGGTKSVEAWELWLQAGVEARRYSKESMAKARELVQQALTIDPDYVRAWRRLCFTLIIDARFGFSDSREESLRAAEEAIARALSLDDTDSRVYSQLGGIHLWKGEHDKAIAMGRKAISLNPNAAGNVASLAITMFFSGEPEEALELTRRAMRLNPNYPMWYLFSMEEAYRLTGRYDEAIETIKEEIRRLDHFFGRTRLALTYAQAGRDEEARAEIARVLKAKPDMTLKIWANAQFYKDPSQLERDLADLRRVGLPE